MSVFSCLPMLTLLHNNSINSEHSAVQDVVKLSLFDWGHCKGRVKGNQF